MLMLNGVRFPCYILGNDLKNKFALRNNELAIFILVNDNKFKNYHKYTALILNIWYADIALGFSRCVYFFNFR